MEQPLTIQVELTGIPTIKTAVLELAQAQAETANLPHQDKTEVVQVVQDTMQLIS